MTALYPMIFEPKLKDYLWGGRNLEHFGRNLPKNVQIAESWEISGHEDGLTVVSNGKYAGKTLPSLMAMLREDLIGTNNRWALEHGKFPWLIKLIDANKRLSVQVHPDDEYAFTHERNELGKTEMWVVLEAKPDAAIIYGLSKETTPDVLQQAIKRGELEEFLNKIPVSAGDHICVPAGTLHAILNGVVIAEIQQNSNTTYRVYDWNRVDNDGQTRALHIEKALEVINFDQVGMELPKANLLEKNANWMYERLCQNDYFTTDRIFINADSHFKGSCNGKSLEIWGLISGNASIAGQPLNDVGFVLLPAALGAYKITANKNSVLLRTFTE